MARKTVKPRFFVFLAILIAIVVLIIRSLLPNAPTLALVMQATTSTQRDVRAVVVRNEQVVSSESTARVEFVAKEGTVVSAGDKVAYVYSAGYTEKELKKLEQIRANIQEYHKTLLSNILDPQLDRLDSIVDSKAIEFRNAVQRKASGNLLGVIKQLETSMVTRQEYMRQNKREDTKLTKLYSEENSQLNSISTWRNEMKAQTGGVLSFYLDGYEELLNHNYVDRITPDNIRSVLSGQLPPNSTRTSGIYKVVKETDWHVAVLGDGDWNPIIGQEYSFQLKAVPDITYQAVVQSVQKSGNEVCAVLAVTDPIGPLLYHRCGDAVLSIRLEGVSVPKEAIVQNNGQTGVWMYDGLNTHFVDVNVLSSDRTNALVEPLIDGALTQGMRVLIQ